MGFNNYYKRKRKEEKAQKIADTVIAVQQKFSNIVKENTATNLILGAHFAYKMLYEKYIQPLAETTDPEEKTRLLNALAKEISDKHRKTENEAREYCEKAGIPYGEGAANG